MREEQQIILGCLEKDRKAQEALFQLYARQMYGLCLRYGGSKANADDLLQEGFLKVFDNIHSYKGDSPLAGWMSRVFINLAISQIRKQSRQPGFVDIDEFESQSASIVEDETILDRGFSLEETLLAIGQLKEQYRIVLNMYAIDKLTHKEIAEKLGISEGTSKSTLSRARIMLKEILERQIKIKNNSGKQNNTYRPIS